jgi:hypothetical protein
MTDVACFAAITFAVACVKITSTFSRTNSATSSGERPNRPSAQRYSTIRFRPSVHPSSFKRLTKAVVHWLWSAGELAPRNPIRRARPSCCALATTGHAAALPSPAMNSRLSRGIKHRSCNAGPIRVFARLYQILGDVRSGLVAPYRPRVEIASPERLPRRPSRCFVHVRRFPDRLALRVGSAEHGKGSRGAQEALPRC